MKKEIKIIFEDKLKIRVKSISKLGKGVSNINYLVNNKYVFRLNANTLRPEKSKREFLTLKALEKSNISPKPIYSEKNFMILEYFKGKVFTNRIITKKFLKDLAKLTAKIHSLKPIKIPRENVSNSKEMKLWLKNIKDKKILNLISKVKFKKKSFKVKYVISHGDICEQNVIKTKSGLRLIDFEDTALRDPAEDIAKIFVDFKEPFTKKQKEIFLNEYLKHRNDKTIRERIVYYEPIIVFTVFVWSIDYLTRIRNKQMHEAYLNKKDLKDAENYSKKMLKRLILFKIIDKDILNTI
jgi:thiamine kinase-like enzyme